MAPPRKKGSPAERPFPGRDEIRAFIEDSPEPVGKREIARAFRIRGADRVRLKEVLKELEAAGLLAKETGRKVRRPGALPGVLVLEITAVTIDGDVMARPAAWEKDRESPDIYVVRDHLGASTKSDPGVGDRILARLSREPDGAYAARTIRHIARGPERLIGIYQLGTDGGSLRPTDRRIRYDVLVAAGDDGGARHGELVLAELLPGRGYGGRRARVIERLGDADAPGSISLVAIHTHGIPTDFTAEALDQAAAAKPVGPEGRVDLRHLPLVTIDGADARDFDDAVWAEADPAPENEGGWKLIVAIADVAHYVRPGDALDGCAAERGNSVYFPDRVVPMLPEKLSNDLCSLRPGEDRACMVAHLRIDRRGRLRGHRFERAIMRSAARLTYEQVQAAQDGAPDETTAPLADPVLAPLYGAYRALAQARADRQALEIDLPERKVVLDDAGKVADIVPRARLDSHRLIEEFMICANVAAAETLEKRRQPCMYRVHEPPDLAKLESLRDGLKEFGIAVPKADAVSAETFNAILAQVEGKPHGAMVNELVLRSQTQAYYSPANLGHFGLSLDRYAHFTSPIRRYSDLVVHRALIGPGGRDGIGPAAAASLIAVGERISKTERRAMAAERDASDRYLAEFMAAKVGATFDGTITGVTRFGLFVRLAETGADGLVPMSGLGDDYYDHDEARHSLVGRRTGRRFRLGDAMTVRLAEADGMTGSLLLEPAENAPGRSPGRTDRPGSRPGGGAAGRNAGGKTGGKTGAGKGAGKGARTGGAKRPARGRKGR